VRIIADTNVLVRAVMGDDPRQSAAARAELEAAEAIAIPLPVLCEFCWVLRRGYGVDAAGLQDVIRRLMSAANVLVDREAVESGLRFLAAGGDFADGAIVQEGRRLGGAVFVSFDRKAAQLAAAERLETRLLA